MILDMYITMLPVILAGVFNMIFTKTKIYKNNCSPIDSYKKLKDGKRLFGDNKTWIGMFSMCIICMIVQIVWGIICKYTFLAERNNLYSCFNNDILLNGIAGFLFGLMYMLFELPNSFIKRRLDISPGKTTKGIIGIVFFVIDQIDSLFGVILILVILAKISLVNYFEYIALGGLTHISVNLILYKLKIRKNL